MILVNQILKLFLLLLLTLFISCSKNTLIIDGNTMGTTYSISVYNPSLSKKELQNKIDSVLIDINSHFSTYIKDSEISKINNVTDTNAILISDKFKIVLNEALFYCVLSNGSYDITIEHLVNMWGFGKNRLKEFPNINDINIALDKTGYKKIILNDNFLIKKHPDIKLDLNSLAKGYAVDQIYLLLETLGHTDFLVEIGGELRSKGNNFYGNWLIGIQNPNDNSIIKKIKLNDYSMATSGTYNNYFEYEGVFYSHIINPISGYPFEYQTASVTILATNCMMADAFATLCMTMPAKDALILINSNDNVEGYIIEIDSDGRFIEYQSTMFDRYITF